jgi:hypothetical protein
MPCGGSFCCVSELQPLASAFSCKLSPWQRSSLNGRVVYLSFAGTGAPLAEVIVVDGSLALALLAALHPAVGTVTLLQVCVCVCVCVCGTLRGSAELSCRTRLSRCEACGRQASTPPPPALLASALPGE